MVNRAAARAGLTDITLSSSWGQFLWAIALEVGEAHFQIANLRNLFDISTAAGSDLDEVAKTIVPDILERLPARFSYGEVVFTRPSDDGSNAALPAGTIVSTPDGVKAVTLEAAIVNTGGPEVIPGNGTGRDTNAVAARAITPGDAGNVASGGFDRIVGASSGFTALTNTIAFIGGSNLESDDSYRRRLIAYVESLSRCTPGAIEAALRGLVDPVTGKDARYVKVIEDPIDRGNFIVYVDDGSGTAADDAIDLSPSGTVTSIAGPSPAVLGASFTLVATESLFREDMVGSSVMLAGSSFAANNVTPDFTTGVGRILTFIDSRTITYAAAAGADQAQAAPATFTVGNAFPISPWGSGAVGGEEFIQLGLSPVDERSAFTVTSYEATGHTLLRDQLVRGSDYFLNPASGVIYLNPPLVPGEYLEVAYDAYGGLIEYLQRILDGDNTDRGSFPGLRAAGTRGVVRSPDVVTVTVEAKVQLLRGYTREDVLDEVRTEITQYINTLGISEDVVRHEVIERIMAVRGTYDVEVIQPAENTIVLDGQIPRITTSTLIIS